MHQFNHELTKIHIVDLQARQQRERLVKEARQARQAEGKSWLERWRFRREQLRLQRQCRAELLRQEWEVVPHHK
jgi:hypothetical protein